MQREAIDQFLDELLKAPEDVMQAIRLRLSTTDFELVLKIADPVKKCGGYDDDEGGPAMFPVRTGERMVPGSW